jgi:hypothetical protein
MVARSSVGMGRLEETLRPFTTATERTRRRGNSSLSLERLDLKAGPVTSQSAG